MEDLKLRKANIKDELLLFCWVNDPIVRINSFTSERICFEDHHKWCQKTFANSKHIVYILMLDDLPIGQVRLEEHNDTYVINYSIDAAWRGRGYGKKILLLVEQQIPTSTILLGKVKLENISSRHVFNSLGYEEKMNKNDLYMEYKKELCSRGGGQLAALNKCCCVFSYYGKPVFEEAA